MLVLFCQLHFLVFEKNVQVCAFWLSVRVCGSLITINSSFVYICLSKRDSMILSIDECLFNEADKYPIFDNIVKWWLYFDLSLCFCCKNQRKLVILAFIQGIILKVLDL